LERSAAAALRAAGRYGSPEMRAEWITDRLAFLATPTARAPAEGRQQRTGTAPPLCAPFRTSSWFRPCRSPPFLRSSVVMG